MCWFNLITFELQELAVLGAIFHLVADHEAINLEAEAMADEFNRLMTTSTYKGKNIFVDTAGGGYVSWVVVMQK